MANTSKEVLEELADVLEVVLSIAAINNKTFEDIIDIKNEKRLKRGAFQKRIYLEKTYDKE